VINYNHRESLRRYILSPEVYSDVAKAFLAFKGFHPKSSEPGFNRPMDMCVERYSSHLNAKKLYGWSANGDKAQASIDRLTDFGTNSEEDDGYESRSGLVVQLKQDNPSKRKSFLEIQMKRPEFDE
jgi:hypothetical protein